MEYLHFKKLFGILKEEGSMIFQNLSVFQNIMFVLACLGIMLVVIYLVCHYTGLYIANKHGNTDDFDHLQEEDEEPGKFYINAFTLKGSIILFAITTSVCFLCSLFLNEWIALTIGLVLGAIVTVLFAYFDKDLFPLPGKVAIVSEEIPANSLGKGKVIVLEDGRELDAQTQGKHLKKGKKVVIVEESGKVLVVKKYKRHTK